jgi:hypothetical protein
MHCEQGEQCAERSETFRWRRAEITCWRFLGLLRVNELLKIAFYVLIFSRETDHILQLLERIANAAVADSSFQLRAEFGQVGRTL